MSIKTTEDSYKEAKVLYLELSDDFYEIENNDNDQEDSYLIDQCLLNIKKLNKYINKIIISDLIGMYTPEVITIIEDNVATFKEASYYIERALISMKLFDDLKPVLSDYIDKVDWRNLDAIKDKAITKFVGFITNEANYNYYKSMISSIIRGTLPDKTFIKLFDKVANRINPASGKQPRKYSNYEIVPPEMWAHQKQSKYKEMQDQRRKEAEEVEDDEPQTTFDFNESFINLDTYKALYLKNKK